MRANFSVMNFKKLYELNPVSTITFYQKENELIIYIEKDTN